MATWKKVVVSGSSLAQLDNSTTNYITSAGAPVQSVSGQTGTVTTTQILAGSTVLSGSFPSAPVTSVAGQTGVVTQTQIFAGSGALSGSDSMTIAGSTVALGGSITADTIAGQISNDTITNAQLANEGMTIAGNSVNLGGSVSQANILAGSTVLSGSFPSAPVTSVAGQTGVVTQTQILAGSTVLSGSFHTAPVTSVAGQTGVVTQTQIFAGSGAYSGSNSMTIAGQTVALGGSITADTIAGQISNDTITNAQLANEGMTIAGNSVNLGGSVSQANILAGSTVLSGSFPTAPVTSVAGQTGVVTQTQILAGSTVLSGSFPTAPVTSVAGQTGVVTQTQILAGSTVLSGSFPSAFISSVTDTSGQTGIDFTVNAGALSAVAVGLGTSDDVEFSNLTVSGDLSVAGTASFKNATNLNVADQYISMNSGSAGAANDSGGIVVLQDGPNGELFGWADAAASAIGGQRWGIKTNFNPSSTGNFDPDAYMAAVLKGQDNVNSASGIAAIDSTYNRKGNIYVASNLEDIWIYS